jgi:hypothetical protein
MRQWKMQFTVLPLYRRQARHRHVLQASKSFPSVARVGVGRSRSRSRVDPAAATDMASIIVQVVVILLDVIAFGLGIATKRD